MAAVKRRCGKRTAAGSPCEHPAGCTVNHRQVVSTHGAPTAALRSQAAHMFRTTDGYDEPISPGELATLVEYDPSRYPPDPRTVDLVVIQHDIAGRPEVLTITRKDPPFAGLAALPGGFVDPGEDPRDAVIRELAEETGLLPADDWLIDELGVYESDERDPRIRLRSHAFVVVVPRRLGRVVAGDDAASAATVPVERYSTGGEALAFDHPRIMGDAMARAGFVADAEGLAEMADAADRRNRRLLAAVRQGRERRGHLPDR